MSVMDGDSEADNGWCQRNHVPREVQLRCELIEGEPGVVEAREGEEGNSRLSVLTLEAAKVGEEAGRRAAMRLLLPNHG